MESKKKQEIITKPINKNNKKDNHKSITEIFLLTLEIKICQPQMHKKKKEYWKAIIIKEKNCKII